MQNHRRYNLPEGHLHLKVISQMTFSSSISKTFNNSTTEKISRNKSARSKSEKSYLISPFRSENFKFLRNSLPKTHPNYTILPRSRKTWLLGLINSCFKIPILPLAHGVYQGGNAFQFTDDLNLEGDEILYIGDHIYGDILRLKKDCNWRTAMVLEELQNEVENNENADPLVTEIEKLMKFKEPLEDKLTDLMTLKMENKSINETEISTLQEQISGVDAQISQLIKKQQSLYNPQWGQLMRAGNEESYLAYQVERYACVYMSKLSDLLGLSPRTYFRAPRRPLSHENV